MDLTKIIPIAVRVIGMLPTLVGIVDRIKDAKGAEKKKAVIEEIDDMIRFAEGVAGTDFLNDPNLMALRDAAIDAEAAALKAKNAFKAGLLNKAAA